MAVVAVIVLIAVLFLSGTVMALAVSSSLHTVDIVSGQDAVHYAAESAVARGVGAIEVTRSCPPDAGPAINGQGLKVWCYARQVGGDLLDDDGEEGVGSGQATVAGGRLDPGSCFAQMQLPAKRTAWTVIGWRGSGSVQVWTTAPGQGCTSPSATRCAEAPMLANITYFWCDPKDVDRVLYIAAGATGQVNLGTAVIRRAPKGGRTLWTIVGAAGFEVNEADVLVPNKQQLLWNTVLS
jgi:hypothetical protein